MTGVFPPVLTENKKFSIVSCRNLDSPYWGKAITAARTARVCVCVIQLAEAGICKNRDINRDRLIQAISGPS